MKPIEKALSDIEDLLKVQKQSINTGYMAGLYNGLEVARCCITGGNAELCNNPDKSFIAHIQSHLKKGEKVICKICGKTAEEIVKS